MKEIKIQDTTYKIKGNALTYVLFKKVFGKGIYEDINIVKTYMIKQLIIAEQGKRDGKSTAEITEEISDVLIHDLSDFIESIIRLTYILIKTADNSFMDFEEWLTTFVPDLKDNWICEVAEYAADCFRG